MTTAQTIVELATKGNVHILDITGEIQRFVANSGVATGQVTCMVTGSTGAITTIEFEPGLVRHDVRALMERIAPEDGVYEHEKTWNDDNGHSHLRASLVGPSLALPVIDGAVPLGTWQQIVLIDFDTRSRRRRIAVTVVGE